MIVLERYAVGPTPLSDSRILGILIHGGVSKSSAERYSRLGNADMNDLVPFQLVLRPFPVDRVRRLSQGQASARRVVRRVQLISKSELLHNVSESETRDGRDTIEQVHWRRGGQRSEMEPIVKSVNRQLDFAEAERAVKTRGLRSSNFEPVLPFHL
jgi:hypothetical protein